MRRAHTIVCLVVASLWLLGAGNCARADCSTTELPFLAGVADEFAPPPEPTYPSMDFLSYMIAYWPQPPTRQFDTQGANLALIHSFHGWAGPVCGARLELRLAASGDALAYNDGIWLSLLGGPDLWDSFEYMTTIENVVGSWGPGSVATVELDLADLPESASFPTNVLDALSDGELELLVEDDTAVDYALLSICVCPTAVEGTTWGRVKSLYVEPSGGPGEGEER